LHQLDPGGLLVDDRLRELKELAMLRPLKGLFGHINSILVVRDHPPSTLRLRNILSYNSASR
jgi:hypothetical protein